LAGAELSGSGPARSGPAPPGYPGKPQAQLELLGSPGAMVAADQSVKAAESLGDPRILDPAEAGLGAAGAEGADGVGSVGVHGRSLSDGVRH